MKRIVIRVTATLATLTLLAGPLAAHGVGKGGSGDRDGFPANLFDLFDGNGDDVLTMEEIQASWAERFSDADADGDGQLSANELSNAVEAWRSEHRDRRIRNRIERHDTNDDGLLSLEEATAAFQSERIERLFGRLDADGDGSVTQAEVDDKSRSRWWRHWRGREH